MLEERPGNQRNVAKGRAAEAGDRSGARGRSIPRRTRQMVQVLLADGLELLQIVFRVELLFVNRLLANDGVEEVAVPRHAAAWRSRHVALGIDQRVTSSS